ncbi:RNA helicase [Ascochyta rabiei]|uniref:RNA helicase n=1 Tax=Didymella rabiei TaxID=5454 RepID=UPI0022098E44|nr:RNA helicase [Ascochyta rabiei]UPX10610.1 RNA helicase [Ascochyta rabiei]
MLKSTTNGATSSRHPTSTSRGLLLDSAFQTPANPPPQSGSPEQWHAYVNGGAQVDDARMLQKRREEEALFREAHRNGTPQPVVTDAGKLIETSPRKPAPSISSNTSLLVDLDVNTSYDAHPLHSEQASYASAARTRASTHGGSEWSLLD